MVLESGVESTESESTQLSTHCFVDPTNRRQLSTGHGPNRQQSAGFEGDSVRCRLTPRSKQTEAKSLLLFLIAYTDSTEELKSIATSRGEPSLGYSLHPYTDRSMPTGRELPRSCPLYILLVGRAEAFQVMPVPGRSIESTGDGLGSVQSELGYEWGWNVG